MLQALVVFAFFAVIPVIFIIREILFLRRIRCCTMPVEGKVTALHEEDFFLLRRRRSLFYVSVQYPWGERVLSGTTEKKFTYDTYGVDLPVTVYVDPDNPEYFILPRERTVSRNNILGMALELLLLAFLAGMISVEATERKEQKAFQDKLTEAMLSGDEDAVTEMWEGKVHYSDGEIH